MTRRLAALGGALFLGLAATAGGSTLPQGGGDASRSRTQGAFAGSAPVSFVWSRANTGIRTPVVVTDGAAADAQRVVYGTSAGVLHLANLATGAAIGPEEGTRIVSAPIDADAGDTFGTGATTIGVADTSTASRPGVIYAVHNDGGGVEIARIDAATGKRLDDVDTAVASSFGCSANGSPVLAPPAAGGMLVLFVTLRGSCAA